MSPLTKTPFTFARRDIAAIPLAIVGCAVLCLALCASSARAGTWTLASCTQPDGQPAPTEGWSTSATGNVGPDSGDTNTCAEGGDLSAVTSGEAPQGAYEGPEWVFTAPAGSTIAGGSITATLTSPHGQAWLGTPSASYESADVVANCQYNLACGQDGALSGAFPITHLGGSNLYAVAVCVGPYEGATSCPANGGIDAGVYVSSAAIALANTATPAASGFGGTLLSPNAQGTQELTFLATDPGGPGVYLVTAQIDGKTVYSGTPDNNEGRCIPIGETGGTLIFDHEQPCRASESVDLPINTATLANGQHTLKVTIEDAAENTSVVYDGPITTLQPSNSSLGALPGPGTSAGASLARGLGQPNGTAASEGARLRLGQHSRLTRRFAKRAPGGHARPADRRRNARPAPAGRRRAGPQASRSCEDERDWNVRGERAGWTVADDRGGIPGVLKRQRLRSVGQDHRVGRGWRTTWHQPTAHKRRRCDHTHRPRARASPTAGRERRSARPLPRTLGALPHTTDGLGGSLHRRLSVRGSERTFSLPRGSSSKPGRLLFQPRSERGGRCCHRLAPSPSARPAAL
jgi:hypothetical protein